VVALSTLEKKKKKISIVGSKPVIYSRIGSQPVK
jgi:hypothetical protein